MKTNRNQLIPVGCLCAASRVAPNPAQAHLDTLDEPVVAAANATLETQDITPTPKTTDANQHR